VVYIYPLFSGPAAPYLSTFQRFFALVERRNDNNAMVAS
jgi:hypothetical protein